MPVEMTESGLVLGRSEPVYLIRGSYTKKGANMLFAGDRDRFNTIKQNVSYYNEAAAIYNSIMQQDQSNKIVREKVKEKFTAVVKSGSVLEFGGGTGLDLEWLAAEGYSIFFCEPSFAMREKAIDYNESILHSAKVTFIEAAKTDFRNWQTNAPCPGKFDAILSNFGVLNYIPDIRALFNNLAVVLKAGGHFVFLILHLDFKKRFRWHRRNAIHSLIFQRTFKMYIPFQNNRQTVFVHTPGEVLKASERYFDYREHEILKPFDFTLIHLVRNEKPCQEMVNG